MQKGGAHRTMILCIDSYRDGVPVGRFYNLYHGEPQTFRSLTQMLTLMEKTLDDLQFPQAFDSLRTFGPPRAVRPPDSEELAARHGRLASFSIRILFRQNASWQGTIQWLEGNEEESFRSVLELIVLMDSALSSKTTNNLLYVNT